MPVKRNIAEKTCGMIEVGSQRQHILLAQVVAVVASETGVAVCKLKIKTAQPAKTGIGVGAQHDLQ